MIDKAIIAYIRSSPIELVSVVANNFQIFQRRKGDKAPDPLAHI